EPRLRRRVFWLRHLWVPLCEKNTRQVKSSTMTRALQIKLLFGLVCSLAAVPCLASEPVAFDILITHARVIDGTGSPLYSADIGIRAGKIATIGQLQQATSRQKIDASNRIVAPGFIDMLGQSDLSILIEPSLPSKIFQGITTEITGEGGSVAPLNDQLIAADH